MIYTLSQYVEKTTFVSNTPYRGGAERVAKRAAYGVMLNRDRTLCGRPLKRQERFIVDAMSLMPAAYEGDIDIDQLALNAVIKAETYSDESYEGVPRGDVVPTIVAYYEAAHKAVKAAIEAEAED